ncbi:hypothetical protein QF013_005612 [Pseudomonas laurylsulfatiphila]
MAARPSSRAGSLPQGLGIPVRDWSAGRSPSRASPLPQKSKSRAAYTFALHHSTGRALARLQLLILIHPPPRQAKWRCSSGGRRAAPFDEVEHIERRSSRSRPEAMRPDEYRSEGTPSLSEGPYVRGETFWLLLGRLPKVTRCKSGTISRRYQKNGYVHSQKKTGRLSGRLREQAHNWTRYIWRKTRSQGFKAAMPEVRWTVLSAARWSHRGRLSRPRTASPCSWPCR